jgi:phosphoglycolate phosphatase/putative hydrolase of the HAD superfamily
MANLFLEFGIEMSEIIRWREEDFIPARWLKPNSTLDRALGELSRSFSLALLTNNPRKVAVLSLEAMGVSAHFKAIVGLDDTGESKPSSLPFLKACESLGLPPQACVSVGDREDVDIRPARALGIGGILVAGLEEVYALSEFLKA